MRYTVYPHDTLDGIPADYVLVSRHDGAVWMHMSDERLGREALEQAVIEAAKAWAEGANENLRDLEYDYQIQLMEAVKALEEVEGD